MEESFGQLAGVSAFLGGFVVTFLGALTTSRDKRQRVSYALSLSASAAACLLLAALGWALLSAQVGGLTNLTGAARATALEHAAAGFRLAPFISLLFVLGVGLLTALVGLSGWLRSRDVGICTSALAVIMAVAAAVIVTPFVQSAEGPNNSSKPTPLRGAA